MARKSKPKVLYARVTSRFHDMLKQRASEKKLSMNRYVTRLLVKGLIDELGQEEPEMLAVLRNLIQASPLLIVTEIPQGSAPEPSEPNHHEDCTLDCHSCVHCKPFSPENN